MKYFLLMETEEKNEYKIKTDFEAYEVLEILKVWLQSVKED